MAAAEAPPRAALVAVGALAAFAVLTLLSVGWAVSDEKAFLEFTRVLMYLGVLVLVALAVTRRTAASVADGIALGIVAVILLALASRLFFGDVGPGAPPSFFPVRSRLHYPVNYWNGLAILAGLAFPLLLRAAVAQRPAVAAGARAGAGPRDGERDLPDLVAGRIRHRRRRRDRLLRADLAPALGDRRDRDRGRAARRWRSRACWPATRS